MLDEFLHTVTEWEGDFQPERGSMTASVPKVSGRHSLNALADGHGLRRTGLPAVGGSPTPSSREVHKRPIVMPFTTLLDLETWGERHPVGAAAT